MIRTLNMILLLVVLASSSTADSPLLRRYREGETVAYRMTATNQRGEEAPLRYAAHAAGVVRKDAAGQLVEEIGWSDLIVNSSPVTLSSAGASFRQVLSLAPGHPMTIPNLSGVDGRLIGPILDLMTLYADLGLATSRPGFAHPGDHFVFEHGSPNSWADGHYVVLGEDSIDFDVRWIDTDVAKNVARILVRHVPPQSPHVQLTAEWMKAPVANSPNNWVEVHMTNDGKRVVEVGKETFDVELHVSLADGSVLSATIDNPVDAVERVCSDAALTTCSDPIRIHIQRRITVSADPVATGAPKPSAPVR